MKKTELAIMLLLMSQITHAKDDLKVTKYQIKPGDTLSQVMEDHGIRGIYDNMIQDRHLNPMFIVAKNNGLTWEQLTKLPVGKVIYLPVKKSGDREVAAQDIKEFELEDISQDEFKRIVEQYIKEKE